MTLFSTIRKEQLTKRLLFGSAIAAIGALLLIFGGAMIPPASLTFWGLPIFLVAIGLITCGMLPYKRLKKIESDPYVINIEGNGLFLLRGGKILYQVNVPEILEVLYLEEGARYGMELILRGSPHKKVFFPYFSSHSCKAITDLIE